MFLHELSIIIAVAYGSLYASLMQHPAKFGTVTELTHEGREKKSLLAVSSTMAQSCACEASLFAIAAPSTPFLA